MIIKTRHHGFSLVEMSITLLITALAIAAITGGAHLMEIARINKLVSTLGFYKQAAEDFRAKYRFLPRDLPNASDYWEADGAAINGDGNNRIDDSVNPACQTECLLAWRHLGKSNMINGLYSGAVSAVTGSGYEINENVPESTLKSAFYFIEYGELYGRTGNFIQLSGSEATGPNEGAVLPETVRIIDKKTDDANPAAGGIYAARGESTADLSLCVNADYRSDESAEYLLSDDSESCRAVMWISAE